MAVRQTSRKDRILYNGTGIYDSANLALNSQLSSHRSPFIHSTSITSPVCCYAALHLPMSVTPSLLDPFSSQITQLLLVRRRRRELFSPVPFWTRRVHHRDWRRGCLCIHATISTFHHNVSVFPPVSCHGALAACVTDVVPLFGNAGAHQAAAVVARLARLLSAPASPFALVVC